MLSLKIYAVLCLVQIIALTSPPFFDRDLVNWVSIVLINFFQIYLPEGTWCSRWSWFLLEKSLLMYQLVESPPKADQMEIFKNNGMWSPAHFSFRYLFIYKWMFTQDKLFSSNELLPSMRVLSTNLNFKTCCLFPWRVHSQESVT